jgi:hypothetical protein
MMHVSHETICQALYVPGRGELRRELAEEEHGGADCDVTPASQDGAELIIASLARRYWYGQALQVPWVRTAYPKQARSA